jgi:hypothetical protein
MQAQGSPGLQRKDPNRAIAPGGSGSPNASVPTLIPEVPSPACPYAGLALSAIASTIAAVRAIITELHPYCGVTLE